MAKRKKYYVVVRGLGGVTKIVESWSEADLLTRGVAPSPESFDDLEQAQAVLAAVLQIQEAHGGSSPAGPVAK